MTDVVSPFLPGTNIQFSWDSTSLGWLKTCPRLYYYHMIEGWQSDEESPHLTFGIEYHRALQDYDTGRSEGLSHDDATRSVVGELLVRTADWQSDHKYKNRDNLLRSVIWYLEKFEDDPAVTYIMANGRPAVEVSFRFELNWGPDVQNPPMFIHDGTEIKEVDMRPGGITWVKDSDVKIIEGSTQPYLLCGHLDRIVTFQDELFVMDRKTTTSTPGDYYFAQFDMSNQMTLYTIAGEVVLGAPVRGVIIDSAQVAIEFSRFTRGMTYRTKDQTQEWLNDLHYWFGLAEDYATEGYWPQNDMACGLYGGCKFRTICSKSPQVREQFLKSHFTKLSPEDRWNPLKAR